MFRTILFDFDGTLSPSLDCWLSAFVFALNKYGMVLEENDMIRRCFYRDYADIAADLRLTVPADQLRDDVLEGLEIAFGTAPLFPGVEPLLGQLHARGAAMAVVTSSPRALVAPTLARMGIARYFGALIGSEDTSKHKPDPEPLTLALKRLGRGVDDAIFVGDYVVDIHAGRAAGIATALHLPQGNLRFYDFDHLRSARPDFEFSDYRELAAYLDSGSPADSRFVSPQAG